MLGDSLWARLVTALPSGDDALGFRVSGKVLIGFFHSPGQTDTHPFSTVHLGAQDNHMVFSRRRVQGGRKHQQLSNTAPSIGPGRKKPSPAGLPPASSPPGGRAFQRTARVQAPKGRQQNSKRCPQPKAPFAYRQHEKHTAAPHRTKPKTRRAFKKRFIPFLPFFLFHQIPFQIGTIIHQVQGWRNRRNTGFTRTVLRWPLPWAPFPSQHSLTFQRHLQKSKEKACRNIPSTLFTRIKRNSISSRASHRWCGAARGPCGCRALPRTPRSTFGQPVQMALAQRHILVLVVKGLSTQLLDIIEAVVVGALDGAGRRR